MFHYVCVGQLARRPKVTARITQRLGALPLAAVAAAVAFVFAHGDREWLAAAVAIAACLRSCCIAVAAAVDGVVAAVCDLVLGGLLLATKLLRLLVSRFCVLGRGSLAGGGGNSKGYLEQLLERFGAPCNAPKEE